MVYSRRNEGTLKQKQSAVVDDFLCTPTLQPVQYDSEDSQFISGYTSAPGSAVS